MSEKRFYYSIHNLNEDDEYYEIIDEEERYSFNFVRDEGLADQICHWLNVLSDENRQLKEENKKLEIENKFLKMENEVLKKKLKSLQKVLHIVEVVEDE